MFRDVRKLEQRGLHGIDAIAELRRTGGNLESDMIRRLFHDAQCHPPVAMLF